MEMSLRFFLLSCSVLLGISDCVSAACSEFDIIPEDKYDKSPSSADDIDKRPLGYKYAIAYYMPTSGQENPCAYLTNLTGHSVGVMVQTRVQGKTICVTDDSKTPHKVCGGPVSECWSATSDKVTFTFSCSAAEGCDSDTQFWYRLTPSVGDPDDWCLEDFNSAEYPNTLVPRPSEPPIDKTTVAPNRAAYNVGIMPTGLIMFAISFIWLL